MQMCEAVGYKETHSTPVHTACKFLCSCGYFKLGRTDAICFMKDVVKATESGILVFFLLLF